MGLGLLVELAAESDEESFRLGGGINGASWRASGGGRVVEVERPTTTIRRNRMVVAPGSMRGDGGGLADNGDPRPAGLRNRNPRFRHRRALEA